MKSDQYKPFKDCTTDTGRLPGCHASCPKWKAVEQANRERREAEKRDKIVRHYIATEVAKAKRSSRRKREKPL